MHTLEVAEQHGARVFEHELEAQFRCGGSEGLVRWIENTARLAAGYRAWA